MHLPKQGIFMSNATMTVEENKPGSHFKLWERFTKEFLNRLSFDKDKLIFCLWGKQAQMYEKYINTNKHIILKSEHPSYAARQHRLWDFNFKELNKIIYDNFKTEISWL
jgi:uracil-DNA glycosylase